MYTHEAGQRTKSRIISPFITQLQDKNQCNISQLHLQKHQTLKCLQSSAVPAAVILINYLGLKSCKHVFLQSIAKFEKLDCIENCFCSVAYAYFVLSCVCASP